MERAQGEHRAAASLSGERSLSLARPAAAVDHHLDSSQAMLLSEMREIRQELRAMRAQHQRTAERLRGGPAHA